MITNKTILIPLLLLSMVLVFTFCTNTVSAASGDTIYVSGSSGNDDNDGLSWVTAKLSIKNATGTLNSGGIVYIAGGTYNENNINITKNMNIIGESQKNTILNGGSAGTIFYIQPGVNVQIKNITLTNGRTSGIGGAYSNQTRLNGQDVYNGGAINNQGTLTVANCNFTNNYATNNGAGGAIYNYGTLTVTGSTFTNNYATMGGAIYNLGTATINNSTFTGNSANSGGAILDSAGTVNVHFSRIAGNSAISGSSIHSPGGTTYADYNWWGSNSPSGISGTVSANNWVILTVTASPTTINSGGTSTITADLNHINGGGVLTGGSIPDGLSVAFSSTLGSISPVSAVTSNGQATATFTSTAYSGIAAGSATVDGVKVSAPITICNADIYVSTTGSDIAGDGSAGNPYQTISKGVTCVSPEGKIHIVDGTYTGTGNTGITISKNMNIIGQSQTVINGTNTSQIFNINYGATVTIQNLTIANGTTTTNGGAIYNGGTLTVTSCTFTGNTASYSGGAIYNGGTLTVTSCTFTGNTATGSYGGGAICNFGTATVNIANSTICNNTATGAYSGGAIYNDGFVGTATVNIANSTICNNTATGFRNGGAIYNIGYYGTAIVNIVNSTLCNNTATGFMSAGAIENYDGTVKIYFSRIVGNAGEYTMINDYGTTFDADYNWWGSNNPIWSNLISGFICNPSSWVILTVTANPTTINNGGTSTITADFNHINGGGLLIGGHIPDGIPVTFTTAWGTFTQSSTTTVNGQVTTTFNADGTSNPTTNPIQIYALVDNENDVYIPVKVIIQTTTTVDAVHNFAGQTVNLAAHVDAFGNPIGTSGQVTFIVNHEGTMVNVGTVSIVNGVASLNWQIPDNWNVGSYTVTANFNGTNYLNSTNSNSLTVDPTPTTVTVDSMHNFAGQTADLAAHVKDYYGNLVNGGQVIFNVNGVTSTASVVNGVAILPSWLIPNWNTGTYIITAVFNGTGTNYANSTGRGNLAVDQAPTSVSVISVHNFTGQTINLTANVEDYYNNPVNDGNVIFTVNGATGTAAVVNGAATLIWQIPNWNAGIYIITAVFNGTGTNYANSTGSGNLTVDKTPANLTVSNTGDFMYQYVDIIANLTDYYGNPLNGKNIAFIVDGVPAGTAQTVNGIATLHYQIVENAGIHLIHAIFSGDTIYLNSETNPDGNLNVDQTPTSVIVDSVHNFTGQNVTLTANVKDYYNNPVNAGQVTFIVNGVNAGTVNVNSGLASLIWQIPSNWNVGSYTITADFNGTGTNYANATNSSTLTVDQTPTSVIVDSVHNFTGQNVTLTANVKDCYNNPVNGGNVVFTVNGATGTAAVVNGAATLIWQIPNWNAGIYIITAVFNGTGTNYANSSNIGNLTVDVTPTSVSVVNVHNFPGQNVTLTANVTDYYGHSVNEGSVKFTINGSYLDTVSVNNGEVALNWTIPLDWSTGNYTILAEYIGTGNFTASNGTGNLTVDPTPTSITVGDVTGVNGQTVNLNAALTDAYGHPLTGKTINFKINGISIGGETTDGNGMATLNYKLNNAGNFTVTAEFAGDSEYVNSTGNRTLTVDPSSDLYIMVTSNKNNPKVGETFTLTYKLGNNGPNAAENVTITIPLPEGFEWANITGDGKWTYNANNNTITWTLTNVPVGDPYLYISGKVLSPGSYVFGSSISSETYNINSKGVTPITINTVSQVSAASTTTKTIPLQHTGLPLVGLVLAILAVFGGLVTPKRK